SRRKEAERALSRLRVSDDDDRIYQLRSKAQVYERARAMLAEAREIVLLDLFGPPAEELAAGVTAAAARARVYAKVYAPIALPGVEVVTVPGGSRLMARWSGGWLNAVIDGAEHLSALFSKDGLVQQAVWTSSPYLSVIQHNGLASE